MADEKSKIAKPKRRVKNAETFRERALKANETDDKPKRRARPGLPAGNLASKAARPLGPFIKVLRLVGKVVFPAYFRNSWRELKLVTWPTWKQSRQLTFAVIIFAVVFGAIIAAVDYGLDKVFRNILLK